LTIKSTSHTTRRYFLCAYILVFCMPVNIQLSKISIASAISSIYSNKLPKNFSTTNEHEWTQMNKGLIRVNSCSFVVKELNRGQLDAEITGPAHDRFRKTVDLRVEIRNVLTSPPCGFQAVWSGTAVSYSPALYTQTHLGFPKLHPRSLLERR